MRSLFLALGLLASTVSSRSPQHVNKRHLLQHRPRAEPHITQGATATPPNDNRSAPIIPQNANTTKYVVDGTALPDTPFDVGESYAGLMPISSKLNASELFFWFFPSANSQADEEILIWLNGGPGCSSLIGLLQENGPFLWQPGAYSPMQNTYSWTNLTNVVWIEYPIGTGFSTVRADAGPHNEIDAAAQFLGFWRNFVDTFGLHNRKVYITGESYAGYYVPYIADAMHNETDKAYYNVDSIMFYDAVTTSNALQTDIPVVPFVDFWSGLFPCNNTFKEDIHKRWQDCGYKEIYEQALVFPPKGHLPPPPAFSLECNIWGDILFETIRLNPCFNEYDIRKTCPTPGDVLTNTGAIFGSGDDVTTYFNRTDVKRAINGPITSWSECGASDLFGDTSPASGLSVLPRVIEKNKRTVIGHGLLDYILLANGTVAMIQNMTWNGAQGFSTPPERWTDLYVPYHQRTPTSAPTGDGQALGKWNTERGLTFSTIELSGHMVPEYQPGAAYRQLEFLLGRVANLSVVGPFTTESGGLGSNWNDTVANASVRLL